MSVDQEALEAIGEVAREAFERGGGWEQLAASGVLSAGVPEEYDGAGLGLAGVAEVLRIQGAAADESPLLSTMIGGLVIEAFGTPEQRDTWLPAIASGAARLGLALSEPGHGLLSGPDTRLENGRLTGRKIRVSNATDADLLIVSARAADESVLALVDASDPGIGVTTEPSSLGLINQDSSYATVVFDNVPTVALGAGAVDQTRALVIAGILARAAGLVAGACDLTAGYLKERTQFGRALAEFQAVAQQIADVYVAARTLDLVAANAVERVGSGAVEARDLDLAVGAYWACVEAPQALHTCHHLHGGMGVDETYPLHRYYSQVTDLVHVLGGADANLEAIAPEDPSWKNPELTEDQRTLKAQLRSYFAGLASPEEHHEMGRDRHGPVYQRTIKQMGTDGWMGVGWPKEYGGHGFGDLEQTIFANEAQYADVHLPSVTLQTVGPTLQAYGTSEQKERFLGPILAGDVHFAIGYSEPDAGTDLASLRTSAKLIDDGEGEPFYLVNGQKMWTTGGHQADFVWLAVRTDADAPKHKGISILIVDTTDPGYSWTPIITADGSHHVNATFYQDVRVPVSMRVGEENAGWQLITTQLNHERVMLAPAGRIEGLRDRVVRWAEKAGVADRADVQRVLGQATAVFRVNELLNWEVAHAGERNKTIPAAQAAAAQKRAVADASSSKVFAADRIQTVGRALAGIVHRYGDPADPETAELMSYLDAQAKRNIVLTFGGGVTEVQKELISMFGLGLPRVPR
ncbi:MAG: acyl-CoA dehydrogenase [Nocardioides sp.]